MSQRGINRLGLSSCSIIGIIHWEIYIPPDIAVEVAMATRIIPMPSLKSIARSAVPMTDRTAAIRRICRILSCFVHKDRRYSMPTLPAVDALDYCS